jgi:catechol 2,3-dioxygenase-like lactoylglutathione lyase family enzyme
MPVTHLIGFSLTVADLAGTAAFYRDSLGLETGPERSFHDPVWNSLLGLEPDTSARAIDVLIGHQTVELLAFAPPGQPYPSERASNDQWFQHFALVSSDIESTWERLNSGGSECEITRGPPVLLPPNTGSVTAFKFRDPEGHPLELISFPPGVGAPVWQKARGGGILGCDHTAISVIDLDRSLHFYTHLLGFRIAGRSLNHGPEQDRLDDLPGCEVDVVALEPTTVTTPHVELLHYRMPPGRVSSTVIQVNDVASVRQLHKVDDLSTLVERLIAEGTIFVSPGIVMLKDATAAAAVRDPDGHMILLIE